MRLQVSEIRIHYPGHVRSPQSSLRTQLSRLRYEVAALTSQTQSVRLTRSGQRSHMGLTHSALTSTTHPSTQSGLRCQDSVQPYCTFDAHGHATTLYSCSPSRQYTEYAVGCTVRVPTVVRTRCVLLLRSYYVRRYTVIRISHFRGSLLCRDSCVHLSVSRLTTRRAGDLLLPTHYRVPTRRLGRAYWILLRPLPTGFRLS